MPFFEFKGRSCPNAPEKGMECDHVVRIHGTAPKIGCDRKCPLKGCKGKVNRVFSTGVMAIVRDNMADRYAPQMNNSYRSNINGQDVRFSFVDHTLGDPETHRNLSAMGKRVGVKEVSGLSRARLDEKTGKMSVQVVSNVPDPLGMMQRAQAKGETTTTKKMVNQHFKVRPRKGKK